MGEIFFYKFFWYVPLFRLDFSYFLQTLKIHEDFWSTFFILNFLVNFFNLLRPVSIFLVLMLMCTACTHTQKNYRQPHTDVAGHLLLLFPSFNIHIEPYRLSGWTSVFLLQRRAVHRWIMQTTGRHEAPKYGYKILRTSELLDIIGRAALF